MRALLFGEGDFLRGEETGGCADHGFQAGDPVDRLDRIRDLMIAMRLVTRNTARTIVAPSRETSIANDVTWPMLVGARAGTVGYSEGDGIRFLDRDGFGQDGDHCDHDPHEWHQRTITATAHVTANVEFDPA